MHFGNFGIPVIFQGVAINIGGIACFNMNGSESFQVVCGIIQVCAITVEQYLFVLKNNVAYQKSIIALGLVVNHVFGADQVNFFYSLAIGPKTLQAKQDKY